MAGTWQDVEAIKKLKARYFRLLDAQQWDEFIKVFAPGARISFPEIDTEYPSGEAFAEFAKTAMEGVVSVHQGYLPEIDFQRDDAASGIWAMTDDLDAPNGMLQSNGQPVRMRGAGHYHERYVKSEGEWKIAEMELRRMRLDIG